MHRSIFGFIAHSDTPAPLTFMGMVYACLKRIGVTLDDRIILAFDYGRSWRKEVDPIYKAQRKEYREGQESPDFWTEIYGEFNKFFKELEPAINWNYVKYNTLEADDWASMIARFYPNNEIILISADEDWQMLTAFKNVRIFSPITKKYKFVKDPIKVFQKKIKGDKSDNLLTVPKTEAEIIQRRTIVNLLELPPHIDTFMKDILMTLPQKNLYLDKIPYVDVVPYINNFPCSTLRERIKGIYGL